MKKIGEILWDLLLKLQRVFMVITAIAVVLLVFVPLLLRELGTSFPGYEEFLLPVAFWMYMLGAAHGSYEKSHIRADILGRLLTGKAQTAVEVATSILAFLLGAVFTYWAWVLVQWGLFTGATSSIYKIPIVWGQASILVGLVISTIYNFVYMIKDLRNLFVGPCAAQTTE